MTNAVRPLAALALAHLPGQVWAIARWELIMLKSACSFLAVVASLVLPSLASAQEAPAAATEEGCTINMEVPDETHEVLARHGLNFAGYDALCTRLRDAGLGVRSSDTRGLLSGRTYALATMTLYDLETGIAGWQTASTTMISEGQSAEITEEAVMEVVDSGLESIAANAEDFVASVGEELARMRQVAITPPSPRAPMPVDCGFGYGAPESLFEDVAGWADFSFGDRALCERMHAAGLRFVLTGHKGEIDGRSFAWIMVRLADQHWQVNSTYYTATITTGDPGQTGIEADLQQDSAVAAMAAMASDQEAHFSAMQAELARVGEVMSDPGYRSP